jgi:hypothetical protein
MKYNIYYYNRRELFIVTDDTPHALENYLADLLNLDPESDEDCEIVLEILEDEIVDVASDLALENIDLVSKEDFEDAHAVAYEI